ncbi:hypothetical protein C5167_033008 [Papaver somniferum]|uniref:Uncharacterized protein n=1 Tax=Papaver somniferum TaxID=3469 RepID=A0A4Y7KCJ2_PAPSO|nr:hypothetical protein C5167_033008 [Papaver somniferum]
MKLGMLGFDLDKNLQYAKIDSSSAQSFSKSQSHRMGLGFGREGSKQCKLMERRENHQLHLLWVDVADNYFTGSLNNLKKWIGHPRFELTRPSILIKF